MKDLVHPYIPNSVEKVRRELIDAIGIKECEDLFKDIPKKFRLKGSLNLPVGIPELMVKRKIRRILRKNISSEDIPIFTGGGCWPHYVPSAVKTIVNRTELSTSYTPYQAEASQGILQILFEYQSMICELLDMEVANSSMYDWATALGEGARMAARYTRRRKILVPATMSPERYSTLRVYTEPSRINLERVEYDPKSGQIDLESLKDGVDGDTAAVYIENPSYLGFIETEGDEISEIAHDMGALFIVGVDPISLGILKPPGEYGADIVVGEGQPLGNQMNYGGPLLGILACKNERKLVRQMPGRIIGMTTTLDSKSVAFCMTLQTREQHIRRERATSNICTNNALCAVAAAVYMALLGPKGFEELCKILLERSRYAMSLLSSIEGVKSPLFDSPHFKEFTVNFDGTGLSAEFIHKKLLERGIHGGINLSKKYLDLGETSLFCTTEMHDEEEIKRLAISLQDILKMEDW